MAELRLPLQRTIFLPSGAPSLGSIYQISGDLRQVRCGCTGPDVYCSGEADILIEYTSGGGGGGLFGYSESHVQNNATWQALITVPFQLSQPGQLPPDGPFRVELGQMEWFIAAARAIELETELLISYAAPDGGEALSGAVPVERRSAPDTLSQFGDWLQSQMQPEHNPQSTFGARTGGKDRLENVDIHTITRSPVQREASGSREWRMVTLTGEDERYEKNDLHNAAVQPQNGQKRHVEVVDLSGGQSENVEAAIMRALAEADAEIEEVRSVLDTPTQKEDSVSQIPVEKENGAGQDVRTVTGQIQLDRAPEWEPCEAAESTQPVRPAESTAPIDLASEEPGVQEGQIQIDLCKPHTLATEEISELQGDAQGDTAASAGNSVIQRDADSAAEYDKLAEEDDIDQIVEDLTQQPEADSVQAENTAPRESVASESAQMESSTKGLVTISSAADEAPSLQGLASSAVEQNSTLHTVKPETAAAAAVEQVSIALPDEDISQAVLDAPLSAFEEAIPVGTLTDASDAEDSASEHASEAVSVVGSMEPLVGVQQIEPVAAPAVSSVAAEPLAHTTLSQPENAAPVAAIKSNVEDSIGEDSNLASAMEELTAEAVPAPETLPKRRRRFQGVPGLNVEGDANDVDVTLFRIDLNI